MNVQTKMVQASNRVSIPQLGFGVYKITKTEEFKTAIREAIWADFETLYVGLSLPLYEVSLLHFLDHPNHRQTSIRPGKSLHSAFVAATVFGDRRRHSAQSISQFDRRQHHKIQWSKAKTVRPAERKHRVSLLEFARGVVKYTCQ